MTSKERVFATLKFKPTDRVALDITEGVIWPELYDYFSIKHNIKERDEILNFLDTDFRWIEPVFVQDKNSDSHEFEYIDFEYFRKKWPDHAIALQSFAVPYFWESCSQLGATDVFYVIYDEPDKYESMLQNMEKLSIKRLVNLLDMAKDNVDIVSIWDDFSGQNGMLIDPAWWRKALKPYYRREIDLIHSYGKKVFFHSCGSIRPIIGDLIEIGTDAITVFQINAYDMNPKSIAEEFGGKICFYGGIDVQHLLTYGTPEEVQSQVRHNIDCFKNCGGYIVANCHSSIPEIQGENMVAMCKTERKSINTNM